MKTTKEMIEHSRLLELLDYDEKTGFFTSKVSRGSLRVGDRSGYVSGGRYRIVHIDYKNYFEHRLAWFYVHGAWPNNTIDHINLDKQDNRLCNLRDVTSSDNCRNQVSAMTHNKTGFLGVSERKKDGKFVAYLRVYKNKNSKYLGSFLTPQEAHEAYVLAKRKHHSTCTL